MKTNKIIELDLHGVPHSEASLLIEEWALLWSYRIPGFTGKIITGNSTKMKTITTDILNQHDFDYEHMSDGSILINGKI